MAGSGSLESAARRFLPFLALGLLALFVVTLLYLTSPRTPTADTAQYSMQVLSQTVNSLRTELERYEDISFQFVANQDLNDLLIDYINAKDTYEVSEQNRMFSRFLEGYAFSEGSLHDALFLDESNSKRKALTMGESLPNAFIKSFRGSKAYRTILNADGKAVWLGVVRIDKSNRHYVMLGRRIKNLFTGKPLGVLVMFIKEDHLNRLVTTYLDDNFYFSVGMVKSRYTLILDRNGNIVSTPTSDNIGRSVVEVLGDTQWPRTPFRQNSGSFIGKIESDPVLVVFQSIPGTDWHLVVPVSPRTGLRGRLLSQPFRNVLALLGGLAVLGLGSVALRAARCPNPATVQLGAMGTLGFPQAGHQLDASRQVTSIEPGCRPKDAAWLDELTDREKQILCLLAQGYSNKEIAQLVHMAEQTVKNYVSTIYCKMGARDRVQASLKAVRAGLCLNSASDPR